MFPACYLDSLGLYFKNIYDIRVKYDFTISAQALQNQSGNSSLEFTKRDI
jgi:hypothetical protein